MNEQSKTTGLTGKRVILLGGSSGIGLATAKAAAADGARVVIVSGNPERISNALKELPENSEGHAVDLSKEEQICEFFLSAGKFDHLVYTAGENIIMNKVTETDIAQSKDFLNIRFWGAIAAVKYAAANINPGGSVNLISGSFGLRPAPGYSLGAAICGAMDSFTRAIALELAPIRVNNIAAGVINTSLWGNLSEADRNGYFQHLADTLPVKRVGEAEDIAQAYVYLMKQHYATGQSLVIDGGSVLV